MRFDVILFGKIEIINNNKWIYLYTYWYAVMNNTVKYNEINNFTAVILLLSCKKEQKEQNMKINWVTFINKKKKRFANCNDAAFTKRICHRLRCHRLLICHRNTVQ